MTGILAIETATEACSVAICLQGDCIEQHEVIPREHNRRLFAMLDELLPGGDLRTSGVEAIAYGRGPGSFTGLRIAASAAQGLAFASGLPAVAVDTLACQAQTALRVHQLGERARLLSLLDARIGEIYYGIYAVVAGRVVVEQAPRVAAPENMRLDGPAGELLGIGSGCACIDAIPESVRVRFRVLDAGLLPHARDLVPLALEKLHRGETQAAHEIAPVYVRDEISWKKIPEQGRKP